MLPLFFFSVFVCFCLLMYLSVYSCVILWVLTVLEHFLNVVFFFFLNLYNFCEDLLHEKRFILMWGWGIWRGSWGVSTVLVYLVVRLALIFLYQSWCSFPSFSSHNTLFCKHWAQTRRILCIFFNNMAAVFSWQNFSNMKYRDKSSSGTAMRSSPLYRPKYRETNRFRVQKCDISD